MALSTIHIESILGGVLYSHTQDNNTYSKSLQAYLNTQRGLYVEYIDLRNKVIEGVDFSGLNIFGSNFTNTVFRACLFNTTILKKCVSNNTGFISSNLFNVNFEEIDFNSFGFILSAFNNVKFKSCSFVDTAFDKVTLKNVDFSTDSNFVSIELISASIDNRTTKNINDNSQSFLLDAIKSDFIEILTVLNLDLSTILSFIEVIQNGEIDGSLYEGDKANFLGTVANLLGVKYTELLVNPDFYRAGELIFFLVKVGDTPNNSELVNLIYQWVDEFNNSILV